MTIRPTIPRARPWQQLGMAALLSAAFGSGLVSIRLGVAHFPPLTFTALRLIIVVSAFAALLAAMRHRVRGDWRFFARLVSVGTLGVGVPFITASFALRLISSTLFSILLNLTPVVSVLLAHLLLPDEHLTRRTLVGVALAVAGASLVVWGGAAPAEGRPIAEQHWVGIALTAVNTLSISLSNVLLRRWLRRADLWTVSAGQLLAALALALPLALLFDGRPDLGGIPWQGWAALAWAALVGCLVGYLTSFYIILRFGVTTAAVSSTGTPLVAALIGVLALGERLSLLMGIGALLVIAGVLAVNLGKRAPEAR
jgi:drug/metabolite transporter (DMT)-like permease